MLSISIPLSSFFITYLDKKSKKKSKEGIDGKEITKKMGGEV